MQPILPPTLPLLNLPYASKSSDDGNENWLARLMLGVMELFGPESRRLAALKIAD
jgi:hypothetical protein